MRKPIFFLHVLCDIETVKNVRHNLKSFLASSSETWLKELGYSKHSVKTIFLVPNDHLAYSILHNSSWL